MSRISSLGLVVLAAFGAAAATTAAAASAERTATAADGSFSITFPAAWRAVDTSSGGFSQIALFADLPSAITIVFGARPLSATERALDRRQRLDRMIELTMIHTVEVGNEIVHVGRIEPLVGDWPAFAAVATNGDRSEMITISRSFDADRAYVVTTLTDNREASPELSALVSRVVGSLTIHPRRPPQPRSCDCW